MSSQNSWRSCHKCQCLYFPYGGSHICAAGGTHDPVYSWNYVLHYDEGVTRGPQQDKWRWCDKCSCLYYSGFPAVCPAGGFHTSAPSANYWMTYNARDSGDAQTDWRSCDHCNTMYFQPYGGKCIVTGGAHAFTRSFTYSIEYLPGVDGAPGGHRDPASGGAVTLRLDPDLSGKFRIDSALWQIWKSDLARPSPLTGLSGTTVSITPSAGSGEYFFHAAVSVTRLETGDSELAQFRGNSGDTAFFLYSGSPVTKLCRLVVESDTSVSAPPGLYNAVVQFTS